MNIKTINDLLSYVESEEKAYELIYYISSLEEQLQQKDNIIKEAREYIHWRLDNRQGMYITQMSELLKILDKVGETDVKDKR